MSGATEEHSPYCLETGSLNPADTTAICGQKAQESKISGALRVITVPLANCGQLGAYVCGNE